MEKILRLQRDEFLPLKVIRQELQKPTSPERRRRRASGLRDDAGDLDQRALCERADIEARLARELEEYGLITPRVAGGERYYTETDAEIASICGRLASFGIAPAPPSNDSDVRPEQPLGRAIHGFYDKAIFPAI